MKPHRESEIVEGFDDTKIRFRFANEQRERGSDLPIYASKPICDRAYICIFAATATITAWFALIIYLIVRK